MAAKREQRDAIAREELSKFPVVAAAWLAKKKPDVRAETYRKAEYVVNNDLIPALRKYSIANLATKDAAAVIERISSRAPNLAAKARQYLGGIVTYAIQNGLRDDGKVLALRGTVSHKSKGHIPAVTKPNELKKVLLAVDSYSSAATRAALKLASLTVVRPSVVASAQWEHIDLDAAEWHIPATLMKTGFDHIVPLPTQAIEILRKLENKGQKSKYVFPSPAKQKTPHLGRDALSKALRELGFQGQHSTHGFRGAFRTIGRERLGLSVDLLEAQLAHAKKGEVNKAYDRTTFNDERRCAMQRWANYLDELRQQP
jgi:integrase